MCEPLRGKKKLLKEIPCINLGRKYELGYDVGIYDSFECFKSAVEFYDTYKGEQGLIKLEKEEPDICDKWTEYAIENCPGLLKSFKATNIYWYNNWLFKYSFEDVID